MQRYDFVIAGAGIMGLTIAHAIRSRKRDASIVIIDKEHSQAQHASGRNSGVLHAGFYYTADSLKAKFTIDGNRAMKAYCKAKGLAINECGKLVVAQNEKELEQLYELERRGQRNGSNVKIIDIQEAKELEPNVKSFKKVLHSPLTASVDPKEVCHAIKDDLVADGVKFIFEACYLGHQGKVIHTTQGDFEAEKFINCAGLYADKIAHDFGFGKQYTLIPFKGLYWKYTKNKTDVRMNIYPVPNLRNPFLGVHYTKTVGGDIKIGPTAIPAFWRENYEGLKRFSFTELLEMLYFEGKLFVQNSFNFRELAFEEMRKYNKDYFVSLAVAMVEDIDPKGFTQVVPPGIRAQLLDTQKNALVNDFLVESNQQSVHVLNAVSPAFTCSFPFAQYVVDNHVFV